MSFRKYYSLERYLFDEVGPIFRRVGKIDAIDLYLVLAWKSNRAKNKTKKRLVDNAGTFRKAAAGISRDIWEAASDELRLQALMTTWGLRLSTATALLSVLYPDNFTVYDVRVCSQLGRFHELANRRFSSALWSRYLQFVSAVKAAVPARMSLRDKDRYLWGKSIYESAKSEVRRTTTATRRANMHARGSA